MKAVGDEVRTSFAARMASPEEQQIINEVFPIVMEWRRGDISTSTMMEVTTATERSTVARHLLWDQDHKEAIRAMLEAVINHQVEHGFLLSTPQGLITREEIAAHGGRLERGGAVFPEVEPKPKTRPVRDVPF